MGALLESGLVGNIGLKHLKVIKEDTINKWDKLGFLEGLKGHLKENVAQLYENQASFLINEASSESSNGAFETVVFPIVRRVFSKLLANEIVSVQAMNLPIGKLFYFVPKIQGYQQTNGNNHFGPVGAPNGPTLAASQAAYGDNDKNLYDRFYEGNEPTLDPAGLFDYSKGAYTAITTSAVTTVLWSNGVMVPGAYTLTAGQNATTGADGGATYRKAIIVMSGFSSVGEGKLIGPDGQEVDSEAFLSDLRVQAVDTGAFSGMGTGDLLFRVVTQKYGKGIVQYGQQRSTTWSSDGNGGSYYDICDSTGTIYLEVDLQVPCALGVASLDGYSGLTLTTAGTAAVGTQFKCIYRRYKSLEFEDQIGEVSFDLQSVTVSVTERKLRAQWSPELAQDVAAFHNIDAEAELTALLSEQVAAEITVKFYVTYVKVRLGIYVGITTDGREEHQLIH